MGAQAARLLVLKPGNTAPGPEGKEQPMGSGSLQLCPPPPGRGSPLCSPPFPSSPLPSPRLLPSSLPAWVTP